MSQLIDNLNLIVSIKSDIKSAIENKGVDMTGVSFPGYASKIGEISGGGGWDQKSVTEGMAKIINLDNSASFVASYAFKNNTTIQTVNLSMCSYIDDEAFYGCSSLSQVSLPECTSIDFDAFYGCSSLSQVSLPMCSFIDNYVFQNCSSLTQISLPVCNHIGDNAFQNCRSLSQVSLPMCSFIAGYAFQYCRSLSQVSLPMCSFIGDGVFRYCSSLSIITIGYSGVCDLKNSEVFKATQITSSTGSIYVPVSLVDAYKSATHWSYFSTQIFPISE